MTGNGISRQNRIRVYATSSDFPTTGRKGIWYFAEDTGMPYIWDGVAYDDISPTDPTWQRVSTTISPVNAGDDLDMGTGKYKAGSNTEIYESSGDTYIENTSATKSIFQKIGDALGATFLKIIDSASAVLFQVASDGTVTAGKTGVDSELLGKDSGGTTKFKFDSNGNSYVNGGSLGVGTNTPNTTLDVQGGQTVGVTTVNAATYDLLITDFIVHVTYTVTGAVTSLTLPTAQATQGRFIIIKDAGGNATTNTITIDTEGSEKIDGQDTAVINSDYASLSLYFDGSNWFIH